MANSAILREVTLTLPMLPDMEIAASKTATAMAEYMQMSSDKIDEVRMAVVEACINSFEHSDATDRKVYLTFAVLGDDEPEKLQISIRDTGHGFEPTEVEEPRIEEKLRSERKRGWGLKIIQGLMDEVEIHSGRDGTRVVMSKLR
ncbi:MAG: ATP-binding protein [Thermoanaerobaculia bacterium]|nr:ATP-binding protein [Thermoanaerobaculia bacterium]